MNYNIKCLLIDDDSDDHEIFKHALSALDKPIVCESIDHCRDAIKKLQEDKSFIPQIIFIDLNMPVMDGIECLEEIRKIDHLISVPVIFYSTYADAKKIDQMKQLGAVDYFQKPSDINVLTEKLSLVFQQLIIHEN